MKGLLTILAVFCFIGVFAQGGQQSVDDEFNVFLFAVTVTFFSVVFGAMVAGFITVMLILIALMALVSAGIVSTAVLVGLYRRSLAAGFKTALVLTCSITSMLGGTVCFWLINRIFHIHLRSPTAALFGAFSGLLGGLLLGWVLFIVIRLFLNYCRQKLSP